MEKTENNSKSATAQRSPKSQGGRELSFRPRPAGKESMPTPRAPLGQPEEKGGDDKSGAPPLGQSGAKLEDDDESSADENPLTRTRPGYVFDKRIGKERKRIAMDDFTEEKHRQRAEEKEKKQMIKTE